MREYQLIATCCGNIYTYNEYSKIKGCHLCGDELTYFEGFIDEKNGKYGNKKAFTWNSFTIFWYKIYTLITNILDKIYLKNKKIYRILVWIFFKEITYLQRFIYYDYWKWNIIELNNKKKELKNNE